MKVKKKLQHCPRPKTGGYSTRNQSLLEKLSQHSSQRKLEVQLQPSYAANNESLEIQHDPYLKLLCKEHDTLSSPSRSPSRHINTIVSDKNQISQARDGSAIKDLIEQSHNVKLTPNEQRVLKMGRNIGNQGPHLSKHEERMMKKCLVIKEEPIHDINELAATCKQFYGKEASAKQFQLFGTQDYCMQYSPTRKGILDVMKMST